MDSKEELQLQKMSDELKKKEDESESLDMGLTNVPTVTSSELAEIEKSAVIPEVNKNFVAQEKVVQSFSINSSSMITMATNVLGVPTMSVKSDISAETIGFNVNKEGPKVEKPDVVVTQNKEVDQENSNRVTNRDNSEQTNKEEVKEKTDIVKSSENDRENTSMEDSFTGIANEKENCEDIPCKAICEDGNIKDSNIEEFTSSICESERKYDLTKSCFVDDLSTIGEINEESYVDMDGKPRKIRSVLEERQMMENMEKEKEKSLQNEKNKEIEKKPAEVKSNGEGDNDDKIPADIDEDEFFWEDYLEETGSVAAPPTAFKHVEISLQSGFVKGMKVEVSNKHNKDTYWVASIIMSCGQLLRLRYDGYENDSGADFWCDVVSSDVHPIGWCGQNGKALQPPEAIKSKYERWDEFLIRTLEGAQSAPAYLLDGRSGSTPIDQIKEGMKLEVQHELQPSLVWIVTVLENVGGRLLLRYDGSDNANHDFWLFYLHHRIHPIGWAKQNNLTHKPPEMIKSSGEITEWSKVLQNALKEAQTLPVPTHIFKDQIKLEKHGFQKGWKVEALHPEIRSQICPASVVQILNEYYFLIEFDDLTPQSQKLRMCCHSKSLNIFPPQWCQWKGIRLTPPNGWKKAEFDWREYLEEHDALPAPDDVFQTEAIDHEFKRGMKLEAVNPSQQGQICAATITRFIDNLMWIHLDSAPTIVANHIVDVETHEIFPVGWCDSNSYPLKPPKKALKRKSKDKPETQILSSKGIPMTPDEIRSATYTQIKSGDHGTSSSWCPKIYFNHLCFSGPFLSKGRIADLSQSVGPGPVGLVLREVLSMLINVAYKSSRVLRELQIEDGGNPNMDHTVLKAKYKGKSYRATVEICRNSDQIEEFCRQVCIKLECCPNLFSPYLVNGNCPENCSQLTKTKYTYYYGKKKKRKIGRPPGGHTNLVDGPKRPGKRRKYKKVVLLNRRKRSSVDSAENDKNEDEETNSTTSSLEKKDLDRDSDFKPPGRKKRKKHEKYVPLPSIIKTRGARMPKFTFERKTHRKISLADSVAETVLLEKKPKLITTFKIQPSGITIKDIKKEGQLTLRSNPLHWSVQQVVDFMKTTDCAHLCRLFVDQEIDGQALLLLTLPTVQEHMELKLGPAIKLCHQIERVKLAFYNQYA